jgi:glycosyltransferase involved in cell wall biosynthesis
VRTVQELLRMKTSGAITRLPPFRVVVAGDGPDLPWMRRQLEHLPEVRILGHTGGDKLALTYAAGDIFFFPSRSEVFPPKP